MTLKFVQANHLKFATLTYEFLRTHVIKCTACNTVIFPQRAPVSCKCGRLYSESGNSLVVFEHNHLETLEV